MHDFLLPWVQSWYSYTLTNSQKETDRKFNSIMSHYTKNEVFIKNSLVDMTKSAVSCSLLRIWWHVLKISLMENLIFCDACLCSKQFEVNSMSWYFFQLYEEFLVVFCLVVCVTSVFRTQSNIYDGVIL